MKQQLPGTYYFPKTSRAESVELLVNGEVVNLYQDQKCIMATSSSQLSVSSAIPGYALDVNFADGGKFVASNSGDRLSLGNSRAEYLEKNVKLVLGSVILVPLLIWFGITVLMPKLVAESVKYLPDAVAQEMGEQTFYALKKTVLDPSELAEAGQLQVISQWQQALDQLGLPREKFKLHIYKSDFFGANAFALPNGTVVITDELLSSLQDNPDAILAILLHEIGHVQRQHSMRIVAQSISNSLVISVIFGDLEAFGEVLVGTGAALVQNAFSRDMEREADNYAFSKLVELGIPATAFAEAMQGFLAEDQPGSDLPDTEKKGLLRYLATHPDIEERIQRANQYGK
ncbi:MAG: M48 family metallopeptidase [Pseudomonadales bacterium]|nr:M48 family metallopeptidase [Pseudomonadales bacterium]